MGWSIALLIIALLLTSIVLWSDLDRNTRKYIVSRHSFKALWYLLLFITILAEIFGGVNLLYSLVIASAAWVELVDNWAIRRRQNKLNKAIDVIERASDEDIRVAIKTVENIEGKNKKLITAVEKIIRSEDLNSQGLGRLKELYKSHRLESNNSQE